ncbi:MAG: hypothetical protein J2P25_07885 [Nocardiopsaceae bacterium]|nr:hypothetical protein [Nocardiopsaceae bacterium]
MSQITSALAVRCASVVHRDEEDAMGGRGDRKLIKKAEDDLRAAAAQGDADAVAKALARLEDQGDIRRGPGGIWEVVPSEDDG